MARMPTTRMNEAQNPMSLKERGDKSPNCPRLSWLLTQSLGQSLHARRAGALAKGPKQNHDDAKVDPAAKKTS